MECIWGYTSSEILPSDKELGSDIKEAKQLFSAILFSSGIVGSCVRINKISGSPKVDLILVIDDEIILTKSFSPKKEGDYRIEMKELFKPKTKIEVLIKVEDGIIYLPISAIGTGMGYQKTDNEFLPTNHFGLGIIIP